ncbi:hypothetical protein [Pandoraea commovens]|uniref:Uncharacterized protein n=1 Tax=Pandoraea commovens TaxID=2508289 RepID=A0ABY5QIM0_9BURK|nr:hypothetical protein [Pandoraea commovens]UVA80509.1 hypothetical protein NTU39_05665 [Pandoraea commovens]
MRFTFALACWASILLLFLTGTVASAAKGEAEALIGLFGCCALVWLGPETFEGR